LCCSLAVARSSLSKQALQWSEIFKYPESSFDAEELASYSEGRPGATSSYLVAIGERTNISKGANMNQLARRNETWSPFRELNRLRDEIDRLFDFQMGSSPRSDLFGGWNPAVDVHEDKDKFLITAEVPGMKKEDIDISMEGNTLCICGERKEQRDERSGAEARRSERYYGRFQRSLALPQTVDVNKIEAKYKDGLLSITLPKSEEAKRKQIDIQAS
jgi:HSP20 family protein